MNCNWDSFKWRNYDYAIGRFMSVDPLADQFPHQSPYSAFNNNPVFYIDPDGRAAVPPGDFYDREGTYLGTDGNDDGKDYLLNEGKRAKFENKAVNWGGTLEEASVNNLKENSTEVGGLIIQTRTEEGKDYGAVVKAIIPGSLLDWTRQGYMETRWKQHE